MDRTERTTLTSAETLAREPVEQCSEPACRSTLLPPPPVLFVVPQPEPENDRLPKWEDTWGGLDDHYDDDEQPTLRRGTPAPVTLRSRIA